MKILDIINILLVFIVMWSASYSFHLNNDKQKKIIVDMNSKSFETKYDSAIESLLDENEYNFTDVMYEIDIETAPKQSFINPLDSNVEMIDYKVINENKKKSDDALNVTTLEDPPNISSNLGRVGAEEKNHQTNEPVKTTLRQLLINPDDSFFNLDDNQENVVNNNEEKEDRIVNNFENNELKRYKRAKRIVGSDLVNISKENTGCDPKKSNYKTKRQKNGIKKRDVSFNEAEKKILNTDSVSNEKSSAKKSDIRGRILRNSAMEVNCITDLYGNKRNKIRKNEFVSKHLFSVSPNDTKFNDQKEKTKGFK
ncbi:hypothetical protein EDEG_00736 [Edhazardia aedis USNM 41457]|uniref:Uncharacterized protein n=1 Tax=Edhazardia aedis (strain USNM 41457) TaxID=1003232 RepID=J8ZZW0_EDHAE|nr:hypothetical protein EDEG_00736 [Edhazardia aedis USNM 41457]|eukprot:EJW05178.1 hypothetical protein EDEG_00736 [Edhazardia aedis USNM 41457]